MGENSKITWCHHTANWWIGCTEVSPECDSCYARSLAARYGWAEWGNDKERHKTKLTIGKLQGWNRKAKAAGEYHRVFVNSLSDVCDIFAPPAWRDEIMDAALQTAFLNYLLLTKRPQNYSRMFPRPSVNMWGGTTVGVQKSLARIDHLRKSNFKIKFLSCEPLLEDLGEVDLTGIDWVIIGTESGTNRRPMKEAWANSLVRQCDAANVAVFIKQIEVNGKVVHDITDFPIHLQRQEFPG